MVWLLRLLSPAVGQASVACRQQQSTRTNCCDESHDERKPPPYKHIKASIAAESMLCAFSAVVFFSQSVKNFRVVQKLENF